MLETQLLGKGLDRAYRCLQASRGFFVVESHGFAGGIIVVWRTGDINVDVMNHCSQLVVGVISKINKMSWLLFGVYASIDYTEYGG